MLQKSVRRTSSGNLKKFSLLQRSVACVFFPEGHPDFGAHSADPDSVGGCCYCAAIYGAEQPWGCSWFAAWARNIHDAHQQGQRLVVYYFPGEVGQGKVPWGQLAARGRASESDDLWDGVGLGGSQKAEVAYLDRFAYAYEEWDVSELYSPTEAAAEDGKGQCVARLRAACAAEQRRAALDSAEARDLLAALQPDDAAGGAAPAHLAAQISVETNEPQLTETPASDACDEAEALLRHAEGRCGRGAIEVQPEDLDEEPEL